MYLECKVIKKILIVQQNIKVLKMKTRIFFSSNYKELQSQQVNIPMKIAYTCTMILPTNNRAWYSWNYCWF